MAGGKRAGAGRPKKHPENHGKPKKHDAGEIIDGVGKTDPWGHGQQCRCWKCAWKADAERADIMGQNARKYLWDREGGKPVDTVNHLHDKPMDVTVTISIAEVVRKVRERKEQYERSR